MKVNTRQAEGVSILDLRGKLTIGDGDAALRAAFESALAGGAKKLLINLEGVRAMDSSGLGELVHVRDTAAAQGVTVKLLHVEDKVTKVLQMTKLIGRFETYDDEIDALASFR